MPHFAMARGNKALGHIVLDIVACAMRTAFAQGYSIVRMAHATLSVVDG